MGAIYGSSYYTTFKADSWTKAETKSRELGGHLITLNTLDEFKWDNILQPHIKLTVHGGIK